MRSFHRSLDPEILFRVPNVYNYDVSPNGDRVAFSWNKSGQLQIYIHGLPPDRIQLLTNDDESKISPAFSPDGNRLTYTQDHQGDECFDIYLVELADGKSWNLTPSTSEAIYPHVRWSPDGKRLAFASNRGRGFSIYTMPSSGGRPERISDHEFSDSDPEWSPDGKWLVFNALVTAQDSGVFIVPAMSGEIRRLVENDKVIEASSPQWSPGGKEIVFMSSERGGSDIGIWNFESGSVEWITDSRYEYYAPEWSPDGHKLAYLVNRDGIVSITIQDRETHATETLEVEAGVHSDLHFAPDSNGVFFTFSGSRYPPDLWMVNLKSREFTQLTNSLPATIDSSQFATGSPVHYLSRDGLRIPALLYLPKNLDSSKPRSSLIYIHGGPHRAAHE